MLGVTPEGVQLENELIRARTVVGPPVCGSTLGQAIGGNGSSRPIIVSPDLSVPGLPEIFAIGDVANYSHQGGEPLPGIARLRCSREKRRWNIMAQALGNPTKPFKYWDKGSMATIGRNKAIADLKVVKLSGFLAWLSWLLIHLLFIVDFRIGSSSSSSGPGAISPTPTVHASAIEHFARRYLPRKACVLVSKSFCDSRSDANMTEWSSWQSRGRATLCLFETMNGSNDPKEARPWSREN